MLDDLEAGWHVFEHLALVLADPTETVLPQSGQMQAGSWLTVSRGRWSGSFARPARLRGARRVRVLRVVQYGGIGRTGARVFLGGFLLEFTDQKLKLLDVAIELFRGTAEPRAPQHGELHF
jgi:hypothetical protein